MLVARHIRMERVFLDDEIITLCYSNVIGVGRFAISIAFILFRSITE
jgi:hypothetical protein